MSNDKINEAIFQGLANSFTALYYVDLDTGAYTNYVARESIADLTSQFSKYPKFQDLVRFFIEGGMVHPDDRKAMRRFYPDNESVKKALANRKRISQVFRRKYPDGHLFTRSVIVKCEPVDQPCHTVVIAFSECDDEVRSEAALKESLSILQKRQVPEEAIDELLSHTGEFYGADRSYVFEFSEDKKTICNTYEWCKEGIEPMIEKLQSVPMEEVTGWVREFERRGAFYMDTLDSSGNTDDTRRTLEMQGIESLVAAPILKSGEIVGFLGVDNPTKSRREIRLLNAVATVIYGEILKREDVMHQRLDKALTEARGLNTRNRILQQIVKAGSWSFEFDAERSIRTVHVSPECAAVIRFDVGNGNDWMNRIHPDDYDRVTKAFNDTLTDATGKTPYDVEYRFRTRDGSYVWIHSAGRIINRPDGGGEFYGVCVDITDAIESREAEKQRLEETLTFTNYFIENLVSTYLVNLKTRAFKVFKREEWLDREYPVIPDYLKSIEAFIAAEVHPDDRREFLEFVQPENLRKLLRKNHSVIHSFRRIRDGVELTYSFRAIQGSDRDMVAFAFADLTDEVKAELEQNRRLEEALKAVRIESEKNKTLSEVTMKLYGFNLVVDLESGDFRLIEGANDEDAIAVMKPAKDFRDLFNRAMKVIRPEYHAQLRRLASFDYLRMNRNESGVRGSAVYQLVGDDDAKWGEVTVTYGKDPSGRPVANILGRDITESRREAAQHERDQKAVAAKDQIMSGITKTLYGFNVSVNLDKNSFSLIRGTGMDRVCEVFESFLGRPYTEVTDYFLGRIPAECRKDACMTISRDLLLDRRDRRGYLGAKTLPWDGEDGKTGWIEVHGFMTENDVGEAVVNLLGRDVTDEHERALHEKREHEAAVAKDRIMAEITKSLYGYNLTVNLNTMKFSVITGTGMDKASDIFNMTDDFSTAFGEKIQYIVQKDRAQLFELLAPEALRRQAANGDRGPIGTMVYEAEIDGEPQWHETNVFLGTDAEGNPVANILGRNITEQRKLADAAEKLKLSEQSNKAKSEFLFNVSHDVRTPMHAIMGFVDIAQRNFDDRNEVKECLAKIKKSGDLLFSLLNSVLDVSRLEVGKAKLVESPGDVMYSFEGVKSTMSEIAKEKDIDLVFEFGEVRDRFVYADFEKANRVFMNILSNAVKYTKEGGRIKVRCEQVPGEVRSKSEELRVKDGKNSSTHHSSLITHHSKKPGGIAQFRYIFEDNGIGMAPEFVKKLYDRFSREQNTTMSGVAGIGLGMSICKAFVDMLGGTIECRSRKGVGTTFTVMLPFRRQEKGSMRYVDPESGQEKEVKKVKSKGEKVKSEEELFKGKRVLLVDDSKLNREVSKYYLTSAGFEVESADDGTVAVGLVARHGPGYYDLILMDIQMPIMDGYEATRQIRKWEREKLKIENEKLKIENEKVKGKKGGNSSFSISHSTFSPVPIIAWSANAFEEDKEKAIESGMNDHIAKGVKAAVLQECIAKHLVK